MRLHSSHPQFLRFPPALALGLVLALAMLGTRPALAQSAAALGSVSGTVTDPQGGLLAGAVVTIRNSDLATTRTATTDDSGSFVISFVPSGAYTVQVKAAGFTLKRPPRLTVGAGSSVRITLKLDVAGRSENVTVSGRGATVEGNTVPPAVNRQEAALSNSVAGVAVTYLPSRDRDFSQMAQLSAGAAQDPASTGVAIAGQRPEDAKVSIDGAEFNDAFQGGWRGQRDGALFFPQTVVREFQVVHAGAGAELGGTNAGFVNVVTKSGAAKLRGEAFYIGRPPGLTAGDAFGNSLHNVQNEFGGSLGGPIRASRAFFYLGAEQDFLEVPYWTVFQPQSPSGSIPVPLAALQGQNIEHNNPTALFGRVDVILDPRNSLNVQMDYNHETAGNLSQGSTRTDAALTDQAGVKGNSAWLRGNLSTLAGDNLVNQVLAQWSTDRRNYTTNSTAPEMVVNGFGVLGGSSIFPDQYSADHTQLSDDLSVVRGGSILHAGGSFAYSSAADRRETDLNGRFDYNSLAGFVANLPRRFQQTFATGNTTYSGAIRQMGLYGSLRVPLRPGLTLTAGLRWDAQWNPQPPAGNPLVSQTAMVPSDPGQWQPRLGLAWSARAKTTVRLSSGLFDAPTPAQFFQRVFVDNGLNTVVADSAFDPQLLALASAPAPHALAAPPAGLTVPNAQVFGVSPDFRGPRSFQISASVEQQLTSKITLTGDYLRNSTWALPRLADANLTPPVLDATGMPVFSPVRPDPAIGRLLLASSGSHSTYDGLLLTSSFELPKRSQLTLNYTLARSRDDSSRFQPFGVVTTLNPFNPALDSGPSDFDVRSSLNLNAVFNLPFGLKVNPILIAHSGLPYTPVIGFDTQNDGNDLNDRASISGRIAARNSLRQPGFFNMDLRFVKDITLKGEGHHLDLFMDVFNVTHASNLNFGPQQMSLFGTPALPVFSAGLPLFAPDTTRLGGATQVQFTARIVAF